AGLSGGANATSGNTIASAPASRNASTSDWHCSSARVTTTRFPASDLRFLSPTGALHLFQNSARAAFGKNAGQSLAQLSRLVRRRRCLFANVLQTVHGANHRFH